MYIYSKFNTIGGSKMNNTLALINAGGRLDLLSNSRSKAALPFAGKFRLIDFTLSNCVNSGIENIGVITQYMPYSLNEHIGIGKPWDLDRKNGGVTILQPFKGKPGSDWYQGNAQAVHKNLSYIREKMPKEILILPGNLVYKMDYQKLLKTHRENDADLTVAANNVPYFDADYFSTLDYDQNSKVTSFKHQKDPMKNLVSMGVYVFNTEVLLESLDNYCSQGAADFEEEIIPMLLDDGGDIYLHKFEGTWRSIRTVQAYWKCNLQTAADMPELNLYDQKWNIFTRSEEKPPVKFGANSFINQSLISNGAIINGRVENSIISPGVYIEEGAYVRDAVILNNCNIRKNSLVKKTVVDKNVEIKANAKIGIGNDFTENTDAENKLVNGLNLIAKNITIAENTVIERNCRIARDINDGDFKNNNIPSGTTVE